MKIEDNRHKKYMDELNKIHNDNLNKYDQKINEYKEANALKINQIENNYMIRKRQMDYLNQNDLYNFL